MLWLDSLIIMLKVWK